MTISKCIDLKAVIKSRIKLRALATPKLFIIPNYKEVELNYIKHSCYALIKVHSNYLALKSLVTN